MVATVALAAATLPASSIEAVKTPGTPVAQMPSKQGQQAAKRVKAHGSGLDAMLGQFTGRQRPQEDVAPIDRRRRQPHLGWLAC